MEVKMLGPLKYARVRTPEGQLTNFTTGDRFVDIVIPSEPLPKQQQKQTTTTTTTTTTKNNNQKKKNKIKINK